MEKRNHLEGMGRRGRTREKKIKTKITGKHDSKKGIPHRKREKVYKRN